MFRSRLLLSLLLLLLLPSASAHADFVRGIYTFSASTYDTIVSMGFNMVVSGPAWETELVHARRVGLKVIPSWYGDDTAAYDLLKSLDTDPVIMAWYPFDEPDIYKYSPEVVSAKIARMRAAGLRKPVYLTVFSPAYYTTYLPSADIFGITPYPIGSNPEQIHMDIVGRYTRRARSLCYDKPLLVCIPAFFQRPWQYRAPDPAEIHNIVYQALTGSPDGVLFFIWQVQGLDGVIWNLDHEPVLMKEIGKINRELIDLDKVLTVSEPIFTAQTSPQTVYHRVAKLGNAHYWIVANPYRDTVTTQVTFASPVKYARIMHGGGAQLEEGARGSNLSRSDSQRTVTMSLGELGYAAVRIELGGGH